MPLSAAKRDELWACLEHDNASALVRTLKVYGYHTLEQIHELELDMWHNGEGKGGHGRRFGLAAICAANINGIPTDGAPRCLERLIHIHGIDVMGVARQQATGKAARMQRHRVLEALTWPCLIEAFKRTYYWLTPPGLDVSSTVGMAAMNNYARFHNKNIEEVHVYDVIMSSAGISEWSKWSDVPLTV